VRHVSVSTRETNVSGEKQSRPLCEIKRGPFIFSIDRKRPIFCAILIIHARRIYLMQAMKLAEKMPVQADSF
jgi:hypothetical protein